LVAYTDGGEGIPQALTAQAKEGHMRRYGAMQLSVAAMPLIAQNGDDNVDVGNILIYILVGAVVGIIARFLVPGRDPMGIIMTIVVGIIGAIVGGYLAGTVFEETEGVDWIASIVVAVIAVLLLRAVTGRSGTARRI
jgi:uncharacterized membrane protein YeaQ/YmgE (transglycosylase-associated protein family)